MPKQSRVSGSSQVKAVIFDSDGTLIDTRAAHRSFYGRLKLDLGLAPLSAEEEDFVFVSSFDQALARLIPPGLSPKARAAAEGLRMSHFHPLVRSQPGIEPFLDHLRRANLNLAVNTNAGHEVHGIYQRLSLSRFFDLVITADDVGRPKPDPEGVRRILGSLGLEPAGAVFIGDSGIDQQTAAQAGIRFWAYKNDRLRAEAHLAEYSITGLDNLLA